MTIKELQELRMAIGCLQWVDGTPLLPTDERYQQIVSLIDAEIAMRKLLGRVDRQISFEEEQE